MFFGKSETLIKYNNLNYNVSISQALTNSKTGEMKYFLKIPATCYRMFYTTITTFSFANQTIILKNNSVSFNTNMKKLF